MKTFLTGLLTLLMVAGVMTVAAPTAGAADTPVATITKELDTTQGAGFTAPNTFQTGALVRYRLQFQCSSLTVPCDTGTITDVLDPNLDFVQVVPPPGAPPRLLRPGTRPRTPRP